MNEQCTCKPNTRIHYLVAKTEWWVKATDHTIVGVGDEEGPVLGSVHALRVCDQPGSVQWRALTTRYWAVGNDTFVRHAMTRVENLWHLEPGVKRSILRRRQQTVLLYP